MKEGDSDDDYELPPSSEEAQTTDDEGVSTLVLQ